MCVFIDEEEEEESRGYVIDVSAAASESFLLSVELCSPLIDFRIFELSEDGERFVENLPSRYE